MGKLITVEEVPQYAPGKLMLDSSAMGKADFRLRVFRYGPSDIWVAPPENYLLVLYRKGTTSMSRRVTGPWKQDRVGGGITTLSRAPKTLTGDGTRISRSVISTFHRL